MRTFIAFTLPDEVANEIATWQQQNLPPNVYPEPVSNLHMTLAFLGDTDPQLVPAISEALAAIDPSTVQLNGAIEYRELEKLAFLVFDENGGTEIKQQLEHELERIMGYTPQFPGPWLAHTTLWRFAPENKPNLQPEQLPQLSFSPTAATLYQSVRNENGQGATYQHVANIFDPISDELDQTVFRGITPRDSVVNFIVKLYKRAVQQDLGLPPTVVDQFIDLYITGSLTTYQYGPTSDCDVSVIPDYQGLGRLLKLDPATVRKELVTMSIEHIDGTFLPGSTHPLQFFVVADGIAPTDLYQPGMRSAWSISDKDWLVPPEKERSHDVSVDYPDVYARAADMATKMKDALDHDVDQAKELWKQIHSKRQLDQRAGLGDYCEGNIVYKWLLKEGLFDRIRNELHEYIARKQSTPPAGMAPQYIDQWLKTPIVPDNRLQPLRPDDLQGYDWKIDAEVLGRIFTMEQWPADSKLQIHIMGPHQYEWTNSLGYYDPDYGGTIWIHPFQTSKMANESLWHEIQHHYQDIEGRLDLDNYIRGEDDLQGYLNHPVEQDANSFAQQVMHVPLVKFTAPYDNPEWVPRELHLDRGDWDGAKEDYVLPEHELATELEAQVNLFRTQWQFWRTTWMNSDTDDRYSAFSMPQEVTERFLRAGECPRCQSTLLREKGAVWCSYCGWEPKTTAEEESEGQQVIYDFHNDRIILGVQSKEISEMKMLGEYKDEHVTLYESEKQWLNAGYFKRLWRHSYPDLPLKGVHFKRGEIKHELKTKHAMAEQTGDPEFDQLLQQFLAQNWRDEMVLPGSGVDPNEKDVWPAQPMNRFKNRVDAWGMCKAVSRKFEAFLAEHGIESQSLSIRSSESDQYNYPVNLDFTDHWVTKVDLPHGTYTIDWTANQFGFKNDQEFPLIQRQDGSGWQREWSDVG